MNWAGLNRGFISFIMVVFSFCILSACTGGKKAGEPSDKVLKAEGITFSVYPIKAGVKGDPRCRKYYGDCVFFGTDNPIMTLTGFEYTKISAKKPGLMIHLGKKERQELHRATQKYLGTQLAIVYNQVILHAPKIKTVIDSDKLQMTFCNRRNYKVILSVLQGALIEDFSKEYDCGCAKDK